MIKKLKLRKALTISIIVFLITLISLIPFLGHAATSAQAMREQDAIYNSRCLVTIQEQIREHLIPLSSQSMGSQNMEETRQGPVYTGDGNRLFTLGDTGIVVAQDNRGDVYIATIDNQRADSTNGSLVLYFNSEEEDFIDGANRSLAIYLNSRLGRHELRSGGTYTRSISIQTNIYLVTFRPGTVYERLIFVSREMYRTGSGIFGQTRFRFYDMNGRVIDYNLIGAVQPPRGMTRLAGGLLGAYSGVGNIRAANFWNMMNHYGTLGDLLEEISLATRHPWPTILDNSTGFNVVTMDGREIRVNPRTMQLTDFFGFALFNERTGRPIIFHNNDIVSIEGRVGDFRIVPQPIEHSVLLESLTVQNLLFTGFHFHMHMIVTPFGEFDVPTWNAGSYDDEDWRFMNGESTEGVTIDHRDSRNLYTWESFSEGFANWWNYRGGRRIFTIIGIVLGVLILLFILFYTSPFIKGLFAFRKISSGGGDFTHYQPQKYSTTNKNKNRRFYD
ncbi:MAG: hypothetical protein FWE22_02210 [Firmicutes bacterium]|nr:hypothetical protein [Bacillota bacterium]